MYVKMIFILTKGVHLLNNAIHLPIFRYIQIYQNIKKRGSKILKMLALHRLRNLFYIVVLSYRQCMFEYQFP